MQFVKMDGCGNDFVVLDGRRDGASAPSLTPGFVAALADRHTGIGCDQVILIETPSVQGADFALRFFNADGSEAGACGNGTRCAAALAMAETGAATAAIATAAGMLFAQRRRDGRVGVDLGPPRLVWSEIPLAAAQDTRAVDLGHAAAGLGLATCTGMGNPHATFFVPDVGRVPLAAVGPGLENHPLFPERANIGIATVLAPDRIALRVWERGVGETLACGSGACAALVAAVRRGYCDREADILLPGGALHVTWHAEGAQADHVLLDGPTRIGFTGDFPGFLPDGTGAGQLA